METHNPAVEERISAAHRLEEVAVVEATTAVAASSEPSLVAAEEETAPKAVETLLLAVAVKGR